MNRRQLDAVSRGDGWHGIRASYALQLSVVLVLGSALFASVVLHVDWAGNPVRVLGRSVFDPDRLPRCVHGFASASNPGTCVCSHGWSAARCDVDAIPSCDRDAILTCDNVVLGYVFGNHPTCACFRECRALLSKQFGELETAFLIKKIRNPRNGGCLDEKGRVVNIQLPANSTKKDPLKTFGEADPVVSKHRRSCIFDCAGEGVCRMHQCECNATRAGQWCQFSRQEVVDYTRELSGKSKKYAEMTLEILELPAALFVPYIMHSYHLGSDVTHAFIQNLLGDPSISRPNHDRHGKLAHPKGNIKIVPFFPDDVSGNVGMSAVGYFDRLLRHIRTLTDANPEHENSWYVFLTNMDRGLCLAPGMRNMFPSNAIIMSSHGGFVLPKFGGECFYPDRDVVLPPFKAFEGEALDIYFKEETKSSSDSPLLYFKGTAKVHDAKNCAGDALMSHDCEAEYGQGVRKYVWDRYNLTNGFVFGPPHESRDKNMTKARFCLIAGGHGWDTRIADSIARGCVPLITQTHVWQPFEHVLRYDKFSMRLKNKTDLERLPEILRAVPLERHARMVRNLRDIYKAFAFTDQLRGLHGRPMGTYHALISLAIVTGTELPREVRDFICSEHGTEFVLELLTRDAQTKVLPCMNLNSGLRVDLPAESSMSPADGKFIFILV